jgi:hypothetical protein
VGAGSGYELTIGTTTDFCQQYIGKHLNDISKFCITQEFGTVPSILTGLHMMQENSAFYHSIDMNVKNVMTQRYKDCFYVNKVSWKKNIVRRGLKVVMEAINFLSSKELPSNMLIM